MRQLTLLTCLFLFTCAGCASPTQAQLNQKVAAMEKPNAPRPMDNLGNMVDPYDQDDPANRGWSY